MFPTRFCLISLVRAVYLFSSHYLTEIALGNNLKSLEWMSNRSSHLRSMKVHPKCFELIWVKKKRNIKHRMMSADTDILLKFNWYNSQDKFLLTQTDFILPLTQQDALFDFFVLFCFFSLQVHKQQGKTDLYSKTSYGKTMWMQPILRCTVWFLQAIVKKSVF